MNLLKLFFGSDDYPEIEQQALDVKKIDNAIYINAESRELKLLKELQKKRSLLEVSFPKTQDTFQTIILNINTEDNYMTIDEFFPKPPINALSMGSHIEIQHKQAGNVTRFDAQLLAKNNSNGVPYYAISLPKHIATGQRREKNRIRIPKDSGITVKCTSPRKIPWFATAQNISVEGIKLDIAGDITDELYRNIKLTKCEIKLPNDVTVICQLEVKNFRYNRSPYKRTYIGAKLLNLTPTMREEINQFVLQELDTSRLSQLQLTPEI